MLNKPLFNNYFEDLSLNQAIASTYLTLNQLATGDRFDSIFETAFGSKFDRSAATNIQKAWKESDFSQLPSIEILDSNTMPQSNGAYAASTNRIYLNADFVSQANREELKAVVIQEIGHWLDSQINTEDTQGDEGELFSALVRGEELGRSELERK
jgi:Zn-dependent protease with chaperone function